MSEFATMKETIDRIKSQWNIIIGALGASLLVVIPMAIGHISRMATLEAKVEALEKRIDQLERNHR